MLTEPEHGWTTFTFGNFSCTPSYLTDVPSDMLECAFSFLLRRRAQCYFDCEGTDYIFVMAADGVYVICEEDKLSVKDITPENYHSNDYTHIFVNEVINDIEKYMQEWIEWDTSEDDLHKRGFYLQASIDHLRLWMKMEAEES